MKSVYPGTGSPAETETEAGVGGSEMNTVTKRSVSIRNSAREPSTRSAPLICNSEFAAATSTLKLTSDPIG